MPILGVPHVVVGETVDVDLEVPVVVDVDVRDEHKCAVNRPLHHHSNHE